MARNVSPDTMALTDILLTVKEGDSISYKSMSVAIGKDVQKECRNHLAAARRALIPVHGIHFDVEHNVGLVRMTAAQVVADSSRITSSIKKKSSNLLMRLASVPEDSLSGDAKRERNARMGQASALVLFSDESSVKKIERVMNNTQCLPTDLGPLGALFGSTLTHKDGNHAEAGNTQVQTADGKATRQDQSGDAAGDPSTGAA